MSLVATLKKCRTPSSGFVKRFSIHVQTTFSIHVHCTELSVLVAHDYNPAIGGQEQWMVIGLLGIE